MNKFAQKVCPNQYCLLFLKKSRFSRFLSWSWRFFDSAILFYHECCKLFLVLIWSCLEIKTTTTKFCKVDNIRLASIQVLHRNSCQNFLWHFVCYISCKYFNATINIRDYHLVVLLAKLSLLYWSEALWLVLEYLQMLKLKELEILFVLISLLFVSFALSNLLTDLSILQFICLNNSFCQPKWSNVTKYNKDFALSKWLTMDWQSCIGD